MQEEDKRLAQIICTASIIVFIIVFFYYCIACVQSRQAREKFEIYKEYCRCESIVTLDGHVYIKNENNQFVHDIDCGKCIAMQIESIEKQIYDIIDDLDGTKKQANTIKTDNCL